MSAKSGFIYIWYDKKHKRFYIGSHWGTEEDGYICSSTWMRNAYKRRPTDFKRRILERNIQDKKDLLQIEDKILRKIPFEKLGVRYYNLKNHAQGNHSCPHREETKRKMSEAQLGERNHMFGQTHSEEARKKISIAGTGRVWSQQSKDKLSKIKKQKIASGEIVIIGHKHTEEAKNKIREKRKQQIFSEQDKKKMSESAKGRKWYKDPETGKRIFYRENI
jgi:hypothetical protein